MSIYEQMSREELLRALEMFAKNWLAHDGCWFLACEGAVGLQKAIDLDKEAWRQFATVEAHRIMQTFGMPQNGGLKALEQALNLRMYSLINAQHTEWSEDGQCLRFTMDICRVQETRRRKGLPDFPCKPVGEAEFTTFAETVDGRIRTRCLHCPPEALEGKYCAWEFRMEEIG